jgi:hypothetical protein
MKKSNLTYEQLIELAPKGSPFQTLLHISPNRKWKVSELKHPIHSASVHSKEVHHIIEEEEYDNYK